jgi:hypothetical protein
MEMPKTTKELKDIADKKEKSVIDPYQTVKDTVDLMGRDYMERLRKVVLENRDLDEYVIQVLMRRDLPLRDSLHIRFITRRSLPYPSWDEAVYVVDNKEGTVDLWWSLPAEAEARQIMKRPDLFDDKTYGDVKTMFKAGDEDPTRRFKPMRVEL